MRLRVLRALSHFDLASIEDLSPDGWTGSSAYQAVRRQLQHLVQSGHAERVGRQYRITSAGRAVAREVTIDAEHRVDGDIVSSDRKLALQKSHRDEMRAVRRCVNEWGRPHLPPLPGETKCNACKAVALGRSR